MNQDQALLLDDETPAEMPLAERCFALHANSWHGPASWDALLTRLTHARRKRTWTAGTISLPHSGASLARAWKQQWPCTLAVIHTNAYLTKPMRRHILVQVAICRGAQGGPAVRLSSHPGHRLSWFERLCLDRWRWSGLREVATTTQHIELLRDLVGLVQSALGQK